MEKLSMIPHPKKVLIKVSKTQWNSIFSNKVRRLDGKEVKLFTDIPADEGYEERMKQNVSIGSIIAVGSSLSGFQRGDMAIINYLVSATEDSTVGFINGDRIVSVYANSTKHESDGPEFISGTKPWVKGDYEIISDLLGYVRMGKVYALSPFIILSHEDPKLKVGNLGIMYESQEDIVVRDVIAAAPDSGYLDGDKILIKEADLFFRTIDKKIISIAVAEDVLGKV